ncbi:MAG: hypothetical protein A3K19_23865 [Lentisphaerae bacterium RIFOXYB12_FULL_65_16]|nr:MAG: hypothetical protein A3K18_30710 [Lentisphaerae bacterium RIFOXYA12_64_32]OGV89627.1 MAG: hypothetical protein A3K19_23865 [Lentisphaerae bacterium RIFOXYB12_FULL_65_16]
MDQHTRILVVGLAGIMFAGLTCRGAAPTVFWASDPIRPGETVLACGAGFGAAPQVVVGRLTDEAPGQPPAAEPPWPGDAQAASVFQPNDESVKFLLPSGLKTGVFAYRITAGDGTISRLLNVPVLWWAQGDQGLTASPGGWVRAFGKNFSLEPAAKTRAALVGPRSITLDATEADGWAATFAVPADLTPGEYDLYLHNGFGGKAAWSGAVRITVQAPAAWPQDRFSVLDFGAEGMGNQDDTAAIRAALAAAQANGGGVVWLPRGRYKVTDSLVIPTQTVLRGESHELTCIFWPDLENAPPALLSGSHSFGIEDLTFYCTRYRKFLTADKTGETAGNVFCRRLVVRAVVYRGHLKPEEIAQRFLDGSPHPRGFGGGYWLMELGGANVEVTDCDLLSSGNVISLTQGRGVRIANNRLRGGRWGGSGVFQGDGIVIEHNEYLGADLMTWGGSGGSGYGNLQHMYVGHNTYRMEHGGDREAITSDGGGGAYQGREVTADAQSITVPAKPGKVGSGVYILDGKGQGQWRRIVEVDGNRLVVDRPWDVIPDASSAVSLTHLMQRWLIVGNDLADVGAVQSYGVFVDCVMADNVGARMSSFRSWGLTYGKAGQPTWYCQMLGNRILEGNYYHGVYNTWATEAQIGAHGGAASTETGGYLLRGVVLRRNQCENNSGIHATGRGCDVVIEGNSVSNADKGILVGPEAVRVLVRENRFQSVRYPLTGDGMKDAWVEPPQRSAAMTATVQQLFQDAGLAADSAADPTVQAAIQRLAAAPDTAGADQAAELDVLTAVLPKLAACPQPLPLGRIGKAMGLELSSPASGTPAFLAAPEGSATLAFVLTLTRPYAAPWTAAVESLDLPEGWTMAGTPPPVTLEPGTPAQLTVSLAMPTAARGRHNVSYTLRAGPAAAPLRLRSVVPLFVSGAGPMAHFDFERLSKAGFASTLGNGFDAFVNGKVTCAPQGCGRSVAFDGESFLTVSAFAQLCPTDMTVALWVKPATLAGRRGLVGKRLGHAAAPFILSQVGDRLGFEATEAESGKWSFNFNSDPVLRQNEWTHVVAVARQGEGIRLYADGRKVGEKQNPAPRAANSEPLVIGREAWGGEPANSKTPGFFVGWLDEVKIWSCALSDDEVKREFETAPKPGADTGVAPDDNGRQAVARRLTAAPTLDGKLDEWPVNDAGRTLRLEESYDGNPTDGLPSQAWLGYDSEALYIAVRHLVKNPSALKPGANTWGQDNGMEVALQDVSSPKSGPIFNLYGFPDSRCVSTDAAGAPAAAVAALQKAVTYKAAVGADAWTCEWRIPFAALGIKPDAAPKILFNLGVKKTDPDAWVIWRGTGGATYRVENAGELVLVP